MSRSMRCSVSRRRIVVAGLVAAAVGGAGRSASAQTDAAAVRAKLLLPQEPVDPSSPMRNRRSIIFSSHLAGGMRDSYQRIANSLADEIPQLLRDLPPLLLQRAEPRLAAMQTSR